MEEIQFDGLSDEQKKFIETFNTGENIILSAPAGSGKSTVINYIRNQLKINNNMESVAFTSSTAISALLINGSTIHSFLGIGLGEGNVKDWLRYSNRFAVRNRGELLTNKIVKTIIIDEFSMISSEFIETMDIFLRLKINKSYNSGKEFGGVQIILIGDIFQLDTVKGDNIISSEVFRKYKWNYITFTKIHRQNTNSDSGNNFVSLINKIKFNSFKTEDFSDIKFIDSKEIGNMSIEDISRFTFLVSTNEEVDKYNNIMLKRMMTASGLDDSDFVEFKPVIIKQSAKKSAPQSIKLIVGCKVLITYNITPELCNGRTCTIVSIDKKNKTVNVKLCGSKDDNIFAITYIERTEDSICPDTKKWKQNKLYSYMPLRVGYAITIHKSQGATLENVVLDINRIFSIYQLYVAVSRVRKIEDINVLGSVKDIEKLIRLKTKESSISTSRRKKEFFSKFIISAFITSREI